MGKLSAEVMQQHRSSRARAFRDSISAPAHSAGARGLKGCTETYPIAPVWQGRDFSSSNCAFNVNLPDSDVKAA
jgi:hypothetical protein